MRTNSSHPYINLHSNLCFSDNTRSNQYSFTRICQFGGVVGFVCLCGLFVVLFGFELVCLFFFLVCLFVFKRGLFGFFFVVGWLGWIEVVLFWFCVWIFLVGFVGFVRFCVGFVFFRKQQDLLLPQATPTLLKHNIKSCPFLPPTFSQHCPPQDISALTCYLLKSELWSLQNGVYFLVTLIYNLL